MPCRRRGWKRRAWPLPGLLAMVKPAGVHQNSPGRENREGFMP